MTGTEGFAQAQANRTLDQECRTEFRTFGNEDPAQGLGLARVFHGAGHWRRNLGFQVGQVSLGRLGATALRQVGHDGGQIRIVVQRHQFRLKQVLGHDETSKVGLGFKGRMGFDQGIEFGVRLVGDLVQAL
ncbi:hypothetical protein D3C78_1322940 [compost metagenome]